MVRGDTLTQQVPQLTDVFSVLWRKLTSAAKVRGQGLHLPRQHVHVRERLKTVMERHVATDPLLKYGSLKGLDETCLFNRKP